METTPAGSGAVPGWERGASLAGAAVLALLAARQRRARGMLIGVASWLVTRATTGYCPAYHALGIGRASPRDGKPLGPAQGIRVDRSIVIHRPPQELYAAWRNLEWLGHTLSHLADVVRVDEHRSHWRAAGPAGVVFEWDAEIIRDDPGRLISWRSLPGSDVDNAGSVHFTPLDGGTATEVRVVLRYDPPGGALGTAVAAALGEDPARQIEEDLRRLRGTFHAGGAVGADPVEEASDASFPASDPPSWTSRAR